MRLTKQVLFIVLLVCLLAGPGWGIEGTDYDAKEVKLNKPKKLFKSDTLLALDLELDLEAFNSDTGPKRGYHPAKLSYTNDNGKKITMDVQVQVRGKLRRQLLKCTIPPFKIKFNKNQRKGTIFRGQKVLKVVAHCKDSPDFFEHYTLQEYLIYKSYNLLTRKSFRVRLARMTYIDNRNQSKTFTNYAFFIESYKAMAERNKGKTAEVKQIELPQADFDCSTRVSVFQYMIGNTDWSIRSIHNTKLITIEGKPNFYSIPFDFDQSGIIDAHYARPDERLPIRSVRERLFRGYCKSETQFEKTFQLFRKHKDAIFKLYEDFEPLPEKIKKRNLNYIEEFYNIINSPKLVKRYFINNYRGRPFPKR